MKDIENKTLIIFKNKIRKIENDNQTHPRILNSS